MDLIFPNVFITGQLENEIDERILCAYALCGWANCEAGATPPKMFGAGMVAISKQLGISAAPGSIEKFAISKGWLSAKGGYH